jgi:hypothetical protein
MNLLPLAFLMLFSSAPDPDAEFILAQARADPEVRIEDAYKWIFHATRGGEHAIANATAAHQWLAREWATLGPPQSGEPLWTPLTSDGRIGRLNLRPYRAQGGTPEPLLAAFLASAKSFDADPVRFRAAWKTLGHTLAKNPQGHLTYAAWKRLDRAMRTQAYPAIHHSLEYEKSRQPAYRVLSAAEARQLIDSLPAPAN